jgi:hypothetical protein
VDTSVGINLCSGTIAKAAESRLSAHVRQFTPFTLRYERNIVNSTTR